MRASPGKAQAPAVQQARLGLSTRRCPHSQGPVTPAGEKRIVKVSPGRPAARGGASADEVIATFASVPRPSKAAAALQPEAFRRLCSGLRPQSRHDPRSPEPGARASQPSHGAPQRCCHQPVPSH